MTDAPEPPDERRLAEIRAHPGANLSSCWMAATWLLSQIDARDARIADLTANRDMHAADAEQWAIDASKAEAERDRLSAAVAQAEAARGEAQRLVAKQAEDAGLWFIAERATEAYLQRALRRLHAIIERKSPAECAIAALRAAAPAAETEES